MRRQTNSPGRLRHRCMLAIAVTAAVPVICPAAEYVVHISVDGLRADGVTKQTAAQLPFFSLLRSEGAFTDNARTDVDYTITLPNHTGMLTGRGVVGPGGHNYTDNDVPPPGQTLHTVKGSYVASVFDVAHDNGLRTGLFASKEKFGLFDSSYDADTAPLQGGAIDVTGADNGRDKIDTFEFNYDSPQLVSSWKTAMQANPFQYSFIHLHDPDSAGHSKGWKVNDPNSLYMQSVRDVDARLGEIMATIENTPALAGHTTLILSADHGGQEESNDHSDPTDPQDYTIPFYVWGAGVTEGDLYAMNAASRLNPGTSQIAYATAMQPVRNGDGGNLALGLLGLGAIPGSTINAAQNLTVPEPTLAVLTLAAIALSARGRRPSP